MDKKNFWTAILLSTMCTSVFFLLFCFPAFREEFFCLRCWKEGIWLAKRQFKKVVGIPQERICHRANCLSNLKQMALAMQLYASDYDGKLPSYQNWEQQIFGYIRNSLVFRCPDATNAQTLYYSMNFKLSGKRLKEIQFPESTIMLFECNDLGLPIARHHFLEFKHLCNVAFVDGHVKGLPLASLHGVP